MLLIFAGDVGRMNFSKGHTVSGTIELCIGSGPKFASGRFRRKRKAEEQPADFADGEKLQNQPAKSAGHESVIVKPKGLTESVANARFVFAETRGCKPLADPLSCNCP